MIINTTTLDALRVSFSGAFKRGLEQGESQWPMIATTVPSSGKSNSYGFLGKFANLREWIGARVVQSMSEATYTLLNKTYELTIGVDRDDMNDDNLGVYDPMFIEMGESVKAHPDLLVWAALKAGFTSKCYDGQNYFDTVHPVLDVNGVVQTVANTDGGAGTPWFLGCTNRFLKPMIFQQREAVQFVARDKMTDDNVFNLREFVYGVDGRYNVGYGLWQTCWGSKQTLNGANYGIARAALAGMKGDYGRPLGLVPDTLFVPPALESAARQLLNSEYGTGGITNEWKDTAKVVVVPWLA